MVAPDSMLVESNGLGHLWSTRLCATNIEQPGSTTEQTREVFDRLIGTLSANGGTLADNCVRTWIYVKDVDFFYQDMVAARTALFEQQGPEPRHALHRQHRHRGLLLRIATTQC